MAKSTAVAKAKSTAVVSWEEKMAAMAKASTEQEASVSSGQFIGTKAGQLKWNGNPVKDNKLNVIVADAILENAFYAEDFDSDNPQPPVCFAFGRDDKTLAPHPDSAEPQHDTCAGCPKNEYGTAERGKGKACKNIRRLALLPAAPLEAEALQKSEIAFIKVPVTSVKGWAAYVRTLDALLKRPPLGVVTEISTIPDDKNQFKMLFQHVEPLEGACIGAVMERLDSIKEAIVFPYAPPSSEPPAKKPAGKSASKGRSKY